MPSPSLSWSQARLAELVDAALPQTQCTRCGFPDCRAYAEAIATGQAKINQCPPGGAEGVGRLAAITGLPAEPLNPANGLESARRVAVIDEAWCIGCTLCIQACPVDAIAGAAKRMHTVLADWCTGCELCLAPCPTDCISLLPLPEADHGDKTGWAAWSAQQADDARRRYAARTARLERVASERAQRLRDKAQGRPGPPDDKTDPAAGAMEQQRKQSMIAEALERTRQRQASRRR
ncbi:MAG: electron transport complex subunit RsxB [Betaproteobacteria bacterium]|nr:electron transport complex subunit RsxB [Betaproteobacteria bacterium]